MDKDFSQELIREQFLKFLEKVPEMTAEIREINEQLKDLKEVSHNSPCPATKMIDQRLSLLSKMYERFDNKLVEVNESIEKLEEKINKVERLYISISTIAETVYFVRWPLIILLLAALYILFPHTVKAFIFEIKKVFSWIK